MKKFDPFDTKAIIYELAIAQALGFTSALVSVEGNSGGLLMWLALLRGLTLGSALSFGLAKATFDAPRIKAKKERIIGLSAFAGLLIVSPIIMAPAYQMTIPVAMLADSGARWFVAIALAVAPDLVAVAVAASSGRLFPVAEAELAAIEPKAETKSRKRKEKPAIGYVCKYGCGFERGSQNALNSHYKGCVKNPARQFVEAAKQ